MKLSWFWRLAALQATLILVGACVWFYFSTRAFLDNPPPTADAYTLSWKFQFMFFVILELPLTLLVIGTLVGAEYIALVLYRRAAARHRNPPQSQG